MLLALLLLQDPAELVRALGSDDAAARDAATAQLLELGDTATGALEAALESNDPEVRQRARAILDSPYRGLGAEAVAEAKAWEAGYDELMARLTNEEGRGMHGGFHRIDEAAEAELWELLKTTPKYKGTPARLLGAIDNVYLSYRDNKYHGWIWHWPYLDCAKAVELADRVGGEEGLWTEIYCRRVEGLDTSKYPYDDETFGKFASVKAQATWKADPAKVRALCEELIRTHPDGRYAARAKAVLDGGAATLDLDRTTEVFKR